VVGPTKQQKKKRKGEKDFLGGGWGGGFLLQVLTQAPQTLTIESERERVREAGQRSGNGQGGWQRVAGSRDSSI